MKHQLLVVFLLLSGGLFCWLGVSVIAEHWAFYRRAVLVYGKWAGFRTRKNNRAFDSYQAQATFYCPFMKQKRMHSASFVTSSPSSTRDAGEVYRLLVGGQPPHKSCSIANFGGKVFVGAVIFAAGVSIILLVLIRETRALF